MRRGVTILAVAGVAIATAGVAPVPGSAQTAPQVLLVGSWHGVAGQFTSIQAAVSAAHPGDWVLVGPGDYREQGYPGESQPAGVLITTPNIHLRGMDRNAVVVDGTRPGAPQCSAAPADQGPLNRNGIEVFKTDDTWIENLTVCNFLDGTGAGEQVWWNGGDGSGHLALSGFWGDYLTATSSYSSSVAGTVGPCCGVDYPAGDYGIFTSNASNGWIKHSYASNMADSAYYIGACQQLCNQVMRDDQGEYSALCLSSTNAGGYLLVAHNECDNNKTGLVSNSQNNDDWPSPQDGRCPPGQVGALGTQSCTVWMDNNVHDNNNPNVPGNGSGLSGGAPVGAGMILAGSTYITLSGNTVTHNGAWGELITDLPDQETPPASNPNPCRGGIYVPVPGNEVCDYPAFGNVSENNHFSGNGFFGNPSNGDIGLTTMPHSPGNCFSGDRVPDGTDPPAIETNPLYQPTAGMCTSVNLGDQTVLTAEALCDSQLVFQCPTLPAFTYPRPAARFTLPPLPSTLASMPDPCAGAPANPWCPTGAAATPSGTPQLSTRGAGAAAASHATSAGRMTSIVAAPAQPDARRVDAPAAAPAPRMAAASRSAASAPALAGALLVLAAAILSARRRRIGVRRATHRIE